MVVRCADGCCYGSVGGTVIGSGFFRDMSEDESSALWQTFIYVGLMVLVVFCTVSLWAEVNVLLLLGLPALYYMAQAEWDAYKTFKVVRLKKEAESESS